MIVKKTIADVSNSLPPFQTIKKQSIPLILFKLSNLPPLSLHRSSAGFGFRMRTPLLVPGVFLLLASFCRPVSPEDCCLTKTVRDASEDSKLNGVYILKAKEDSKPDPNCMDGCVYLKDNEDEEYCFIEKSGATVVCEVTKFLL